MRATSGGCATPLRDVAAIQAASALTEIPGARRLSGGGGPRYRMRVGDYRLGFALEGDVVVLERFLHRREIYRRYP